MYTYTLTHWTFLTLLVVTSQGNCLMFFSYGLHTLKKTPYLKWFGFLLLFLLLFLALFCLFVLSWFSLRCFPAHLLNNSQDCSFQNLVNDIVSISCELICCHWSLSVDLRSRITCFLFLTAFPLLALKSGEIVAFFYWLVRRKTEISWKTAKYPKYQNISPFMPFFLVGGTWGNK